MKDYVGVGFCRVREEVQQLEITVVSIVETSFCMVGRGNVIVERKTEMQRQGRKKERKNSYFPPPTT